MMSYEQQVRNLHEVCSSIIGEAEHIQDILYARDYVEIPMYFWDSLKTLEEKLETLRQEID